MWANTRSGFFQTYQWSGIMPDEAKLDDSFTPKPVANALAGHLQAILNSCRVAARQAELTTEAANRKLEEDIAQERSLGLAK